MLHTIFEIAAVAVVVGAFCTCWCWAMLRAASRPTPAPPPTTTLPWLGGLWAAATGPTSHGSQVPGTRGPSWLPSPGVLNWGELGHVANCLSCQASPALLRSWSRTLALVADDLVVSTSTSTSANAVTRSSVDPTPAGVKSSSSLVDYEDVSIEEGRAASLKLRCQSGNDFWECTREAGHDGPHAFALR